MLQELNQEEFLKVSFSVENVGKKLIKLNKTQKRIINLIKSNKYITQADISEQLDISTRIVERNMKKIQEGNVITRIGINN